VIAQRQSRQAVKPYQVLRYWSTVPFRHGPDDVVMQSLIPAESNPFAPLAKGDPDALVNELARHVADDRVMSSFDLGLQLLDPRSMQFGSRHHDANFWIENASVEWPEAQAPFHAVARLTLTPRSRLNAQASESAYIDVTGNAASDSAPIGSINRARQRGEMASRRARASAGNENSRTLKEQPGLI